MKPSRSTTATKSPAKSSRSPVKNIIPSQFSGLNSISIWMCLYAARNAGNASQLRPENLGIFISKSVINENENRINFFYTFNYKLLQINFVKY